MKKGFTLVEIITVLFVVSLGLVGILSLIIQNIQSQGYNKDNLIAYQLAQEGIELVREVRDLNWKGANLPLNQVLPDGDYYMSYTDEMLHENHGGASQLKLKRDAAGFYFHDTGSTAPDSGFSRLITLAARPQGAVSVKVRVTWVNHNRNYAYDLETILYNWK